MLRKKSIANIFEKFENQKPNPKIELNYVNNFTLLVAVILSAQSTDKMVNVCTEDLFKVADLPEKMLLLGETKLMEYVNKLNYYRNKSKHIIKSCHILVEKYNSKVPGNYKDLTSLPGVGRKTADVVLNSGFNIPTIPVDRHIFRVSHRIGLSGGKTTSDVSDDLLKVVPDRFKIKAHHWLVLHGRYICKARKPMCFECPIFEECGAKNLKKKYGSRLLGKKESPKKERL